MGKTNNNLCSDMSGLCLYPEPDVTLAYVKGHVWVCGPAPAMVYIDVCGLCCFKGTWKPGIMEPGDNAEASLSFTDPGIADPTLSWMQQQESWP